LSLGVAELADHIDGVYVTTDPASRLPMGNDVISYEVTSLFAGTVLLPAGQSVAPSAGAL
jgi:hypothetical protein